MLTIKSQKKNKKTASNKNKNNLTKHEKHKYLFLINYQYIFETKYIKQLKKSQFP